MFCRNLRLLSSAGRCHIRKMTTAAMSRKLEGKVAIVTASTDGIGYDIARRLGLDGAKVVVSSRRQKNVTKAVEQLQSENIDVHGIACHVGKKEHREQLLAEALSHYGGIDILVCNAGMNAAFGSMLETTDDQWDKIFDINVRSTFMMIKETVPSIEKRGGGSILLVSSIAGFAPFGPIGCYSITKTALLGMTKALVGELAAKNIRINSICPGIIKTHFSQALTAIDDVSKQQMATIPLGRFGVPSDCGGVASFLVSEDAAYMTGENVVIAGGAMSRL